MPILVQSYLILSSCHYLYNVVTEQLSNWLPYKNNYNFWKPDRVTKKGGKQYNPMHSKMEKVVTEIIEFAEILTITKNLLNTICLAPSFQAPFMVSKCNMSNYTETGWTEH